MHAERTHDRLYLSEERYQRPKEMFKFCFELVAETCQPTARIADIGCAAGEFIYYLKQKRPSAVLTGIDILPELIAKAKRCVRGVEFREGSVLDSNVLPVQSQDIVFFVGVHSIFDDPLPCFDHLLRWTKHGGRIVICGLFNPYPVDVLLQARAADVSSESAWESGWNMISQRTVGNYLYRHPRVAEFAFHEFMISIDIPQTGDDPLRAWTYWDNGHRRIINGTNLKHQFFALVIRAA